ncbi:MAG: penicillin-binding protein 2 [Acetobacteraceae bacterium]
MAWEKRRFGAFTRRALMLGAGQAGLFGLLGFRLYRLQVRDGTHYATLAKDNRVSARLVAPPRGEIHDRSGTLVAGNKPHWRALLMVGHTADAEATLAHFDRLVPLSAAERLRIRREIKAHRPFIPVLLRDFLSWDEMAALAVHAPTLPGIIVDVGTTRLYPFGAKMAHLVGYVGSPTEAEVRQDPVLTLPGIRVGKAGVERERNGALTGVPGMVRLEVNAFGRVIRDLERSSGTPGETVRLHLDANLQCQAVARLAMERSASAVLIELGTGGVQAMGSTPSFDPTLFDTGLAARQWKAWVTDERAPLLNKALDGIYAPGSTFKPITALAGLTSGGITPGTRFFCPGYLDLGGHRYWCWDRGGHGWLDLENAICQSCDVYFYHTALATGIDRIAAMAHRLGIGVTPEIDMPGAARGFVPTREWARARGKDWTLGDTAIHGIGQGFDQATPLELAMMAARVATGRAISPRVAAGIGAKALPEPGFPELGIPRPYLAVVREGMRLAVNNPMGTAYASRLADPKLEMAGKTGSAEVFTMSKAEAASNFNSANLPWRLRPNALFIAFAPIAEPRFAAAVVVEHGHEGAEVAAPIAKVLMETAFGMVAASNAGPAGAPA